MNQQIPSVIKDNLNDWFKESLNYVSSNIGSNLDSENLDLHLVFILLKKNENNKVDSKQIFKLLSNNNLPRALFLEGLCLMTGFGCEQNNELGLSCIKVSALKYKDPEAQNLLGLLKLNNFTVEAVELLELASDKLAKASRNLGLHYISTGDSNNGINYLKKGMIQGCNKSGLELQKLLKQMQRSRLGNVIRFASTPNENSKAELLNISNRQKLRVS